MKSRSFKESRESLREKYRNHRQLFRIAIILILISPVAVFFTVQYLKVGRISTGYGFSMEKIDELDILPGYSGESPSTFSRFVTIRHRSRPDCLSGTIQPFMKISPEKYFRQLGRERDLSGKLPFLKTDGVVEKNGAIHFKRVRAYDEETRNYRSVFVAAFPVEGMLWIAWLPWRCSDPIFPTLARRLVSSIRLEGEQSEKKDVQAKVPPE